MPRRLLMVRAELPEREGLGAGALAAADVREAFASASKDLADMATARHLAGWTSEGEPQFSVESGVLVARQVVARPD